MGKIHFRGARFLFLLYVLKNFWAQQNLEWQISNP